MAKRRYQNRTAPAAAAPEPAPVAEQIAQAEARGADEAASAEHAALSIQQQLADLQHAEQMRHAHSQPGPMPPQQQADPVDAMQHLTSRQKDWLKNHRDAYTDPEKNARLGAAHWDAVKA